ncbi:hypothetical protein LDENG_00127300 [Lucifuga dentata]|nr:hypothetical protein LDENG_00127300 [Lucifuga dentata]
MKPPPRRRTKPDRFQTAANSNPQPADSRWRRAEQKQLLRALQELSKTAGGQAELDYGYLRQHVPTRSESEIRSVVEDLKAKVISSAHISLKKQQWQEEKTRKPIELWTNMASTVCGALEDPLSSAFSQVQTPHLGPRV